MMLDDPFRSFKMEEDTIKDSLDNFKIDRKSEQKLNEFIQKNKDELTSKNNNEIIGYVTQELNHMEQLMGNIITEFFHPVFRRDMFQRIFMNNLFTSFGTKLSLLAACGLIADKDKQIFHTYLNIRNLFAHSIFSSGGTPELRSINRSTGKEDVEDIKSKAEEFIELHEKVRNILLRVIYLIPEWNQKYSEKILEHMRKSKNLSSGTQAEPN